MRPSAPKSRTWFSTPTVSLSDPETLAGRCALCALLALLVLFMHFLRSGSSFASYSATSTKRDELTAMSEKTPVNIVNLPDQSLPPPVVQDDHQSGGRRSRSKKNARIDGGLRVHWDRFVRKLGSGTAPSTSSNFEESVGESSGYPRSRLGHPAFSEPQEDRVDEVVVDREWSDEIKSSSITHSEHGGSPEKTGSNHHGGTNTDRDSFAIRPEGFWGLCRPLILLRWRLWPATYSFFCTHFMDEKSEMHYNKENWFLRKVRLSGVVHPSSLARDFLSTCTILVRWTCSIIRHSRGGMAASPPLGPPSHFSTSARARTPTGPPLAGSSATSGHAVCPDFAV